MTTRPSRDPIERLRTICLALPGTIEKVSHGEPTWHAGGRMFAQLDDHHHGADRLAVWLAAGLGDQETVVAEDPARFFVPPYVGHRGWIGVRIDGRPDWRRVATLVRDAHAHVTRPRRRKIGPARRLP
jgi:hypothetical protein